MENIFLGKKNFRLNKLQHKLYPCNRSMQSHNESEREWKMCISLSDEYASDCSINEKVKSMNNFFIDNSVCQYLFMALFCFDFRAQIIEVISRLLDFNESENKHNTFSRELIYSEKEKKNLNKNKGELNWTQILSRGFARGPSSVSTHHFVYYENPLVTVLKRSVCIQVLWQFEGNWEEKSED